MSMDDILKVLVDSRKQQPSASQGADPMTDLIGSLLGGGQTSGGQSSDPMAEMLGNLLGGAQSQAGGTSQGSEAMTDMLGSLLGGQSSASGGQQSGLGGVLSLLEMFTGAGQQGSANQSMLTGSPLGGLLQPLVKPLAEKLNISPEIATVIISFVLQKLLAHHPTSGRDSTQFNIDDLFGQLSAGNLDPKLIQNSGMVEELSSVTGLDKAQARKSLNTAFAMVGRRALRASAKPAGRTLKGAA